MSRRGRARPRDPLRFRFFGGKGGVGKTTCAAAAAIAAAERGARVLAVSTDPAHSLGDALGRALGPRPRAIPSRRGLLRAAELDADAALGRWLQERRELLATLGERGTYLTRKEVEGFLRLSFPGVDELVGLVELRRLAGAGAYDLVVVDTAPTGHTLRLLDVPETWRRIATVLDRMQARHRYLVSTIRGAYRPDAADALVEDIEGVADGLHELLVDPDRTAFSWVLLPEELSVEEARDGVSALLRAGIAVDEVVVNRCTPPPKEPCGLCRARVRAERAAVASARRSFPGRRLRFQPALDVEPRGIPALRRFARLASPRPTAPPRGIAASAGGGPAAAGRPAHEWLEELVPRGVGLVLFGGKGGVGKTSCAAAAALVIAGHQPRRRVLLLSADPAHSLADVLRTGASDRERPIPGCPGLRVRELDANRAFQERRDRYRAAVEELFGSLRGGSNVDPSFDRRVVEGLLDLAPPGLDELFAILAVTEAIVTPEAPRHDLVVLDTAPTGHALRLLALPAKAHEWVKGLMALLLEYRNVVGLGRLAQDLLALSRDLGRLQELLRDPARARFVVVTRPAELPRLETMRLLRELARTGVPVSAVLVNALTPPGCRRCRRAAASEGRELRALQAQCRRARGRRCRMVVAPVVAPPPRGLRELSRWADTWQTSTR